MRAIPFVAISLALTGLSCASTARFKDEPVVWRVDDMKSVAEPEVLEFLKIPYYADTFAFRRVNRLLELRGSEAARNTNSLDEVPDSSWFTNRVGVRQVSPSEAAIGPSASGPPTLPITVIGGKSGGMNPGFVAKDATGRRFIIKFDTKDNPEMQTATSVIVNRIFWTLGYSVPNDEIVVLSRSDIRLDPRAKVTDSLGTKSAMTWNDVDSMLETSPRRADGAYRVSSSEFVPGIPKGGFWPEGVRWDDPNDRIPHEHRRELRGLRVFCAWTHHTDIKPDNTLDVYVEENGRRFLRHYLIDFGEALGAHQAEANRLADGYEHAWDWERQSQALVAFGLWKRPWEDQEQTPWLSVGAFSAEQFDPNYWRGAFPYWPFHEMDEADAFWAAKLVMRFDRPILEAIVARGRLSHPDAAKYLVDTLLARRDKIGKAYLETVTPLDRFHVRDGQLCMVDLGVLHGLATSGSVEALDAEGNVGRDYAVDERGRVCVPFPANDAYSVYRLRTARGRDKRPAMQLHLRGGDRPRLLGVIRVERR